VANSDEFDKQCFGGTGASLLPGVIGGLEIVLGRS
jgi:hypothetical protein